MDSICSISHALYMSSLYDALFLGPVVSDAFLLDVCPLAPNSIVCDLMDPISMASDLVTLDPIRVDCIGRGFDVVCWQTFRESNWNLLPPNLVYIPLLDCVPESLNCIPKSRVSKGTCLLEGFLIERER